MDLGQFDDGFQLYDHIILDHDVDVVLRFQARALVDDWRGTTELEVEPLLLQFILHALGIDGFEDSRTDHAVNANRAADDRAGQGIRPERIREHATLGSKDRTDAQLARNRERNLDMLQILRSLR